LNLSLFCIFVISVFDILSNSLFFGISVIKKILDNNDYKSYHNRAHFDSDKVLGSSPESDESTLSIKDWFLLMEM
jgi:hypothetical protein